MTEKSTKQPEVVQGTVRSAKGQKTISVSVPLVVKHPKYGKVLRKERVLYAHDEKGEAREGDLVAIRKTRPLSKTKNWYLVKIVRRADVVA